MGDKNIAIIGVGLIGGSLALALKALPNVSKVVGIGRRKESIEKALALNVIDEGCLDIGEGVREADVVWVATPVGSILDVIEKAIPHLRTGATITDTGSTKANIVKRVEEILPPRFYFIGGHPMAGSEKQGVESASADLFRNTYYLLTPTTRTNTASFQLIHSLITQIGGSVLAIDAEKHDKAMATISHLPHFLSAILVNLAGQQIEESENLLRLAAGSFRDMTRIAASSPNLWLDITFENKEAILKVCREFREELSDISKLIEKGDRKGLVEKLTLAREIRQSLPAIFPKDLKELKELSIPVKDKPGVISEITLTIGALGINIEDIEIIHASDHRSGVLGLVIIGEEAAQKARNALVNKGYTVEVKSVYSDEVLKRMKGEE